MRQSGHRHNQSTWFGNEMDEDRVNKWLTLGANIGVLIGIIFLAVEIRQNTEMTRAQITQSRADAAIALASEYINSDYLPDVYAKFAHGEELTFQEASRYRVYLRAALRNHQNNYLQYRQGFLGEYIPRSTANAIRGIASTPRGREYWARNKTNYSDEFVEFVDQALSEAD